MSVTLNHGSCAAVHAYPQDQSLASRAILRSVLPCMVSLSLATAISAVAVSDIATMFRSDFAGLISAFLVAAFLCAALMAWTAVRRPRLFPVAAAAQAALIIGTTAWVLFTDPAVSTVGYFAFATGSLPA